MRTIQLGIFGLKRGTENLESILANNGEIVALCDRDEALMKSIADKLPNDPACYTDFDAFLQHEGMEAVYLANHFNEHAPFAIKCLEKDIHVISECTSNGTMAEGVALVRAAEKSKAIYMFGENYQYTQYNQEMREIYRSGKMGRVMFAEGEYNHPGKPGDMSSAKWLKPTAKHWRNYTPGTYYLTHSLGPLMYITGSNPVRVTAFPIVSHEPLVKQSSDRMAVITCLNDDDSVFRITGCANFGFHESSYRVCGTKGQMENIRGGDGKLMVHYNEWDIPEGEEVQRYYKPEWPADVQDMIPVVERAGHWGGACFMFKIFFECIRENKQPVFDGYVGTTNASGAILSHRSLLEGGVPYDIPDFHKEEDRVKYENDWQTPFYGADGSEPTMACGSKADYRPDPELYAKYLDAIGEK